MPVLAAVVVAAALSAPAMPVLAQDSGNVAGPVVAVDAVGGDVRAFGGSVTIDGAAANIQAAGASVDVSANAAGSVSVFGGKVVLDGSVGADVAAFASSLTFAGQAAGDVKLAGAAVVIDGSVGGDLGSCGASLIIGQTATVAGTLDVAGASVTMTGHVAGDARLAGAVVTFNGAADKSVVLTGDTVVVGPGAHIGGDLTVYSRRDPEIASTAVIGGTVKRMELPAELSAVPSWAWGFALAAAMVLCTIVAGIVLMLFGGRLFLTALDHARLKPVSTILIGLITLVLVPAVAVLLSATVVGLPIGLALLLGLPLLFVFGSPIAAAGIAAGIFVRAPGPIGGARAFLFVILGAVIIAIISLIPWVGALAVAVVTVLGIGALVRTAGGRLRTPEARRAVAAAEPAPARPAVAPPPPPPEPEEESASPETQPPAP